MKFEFFVGALMTLATTASTITKSFSSNGTTNDNRQKINVSNPDKHINYKTSIGWSISDPQVQRLSKPYYLSIYGSTRKIPVYYVYKLPSGGRSEDNAPKGNDKTEMDSNTIQFTTKPPPQTVPNDSRPTTVNVVLSKTDPPELQDTKSTPSQCTFAIVSCCTDDTDDYPDQCFEQNKCPGPFWGNSPCEDKFKKIAKEAVANYYNKQ